MPVHSVLCGSFPEQVLDMAHLSRSGSVQQELQAQVCANQRRGYRGRTQLLNLILALGYVIRIACRENYE